MKYYRQGLLCIVGASSAAVPTRDGVVISDYGERIGRTSREREHHAGVDFRGGVGDPVYAVADGVVARVSRDDNGAGFRGYGNFVVLKHDRESPVVFSGYGHLDSVSVAPGERVRAGQLIGTVGKTSNGRYPTMPPHLHFEMRRAPGRGHWRQEPWPGPYGEYDFDPVPWVEARGIRVDGRRWIAAPVVRPPVERPGAPVEAPSRSIEAPRPLDERERGERVERVSPGRTDGLAMGVAIATGIGTLALLAKHKS